MIPSLQQVSTDHHLWDKLNCSVTNPKLKRNRHRLPELVAEVRKQISPCHLCERRCAVHRLSGEVGFCGLDDHVRLFAYANLYNEGEMVGAPTFGVFLSGCAFRCRTCYRPENWHVENGTLFTPERLASLLDAAAVNGSRSWMFLGGNPDQSVLGILDALQRTQMEIPIVWNTALWSTSEMISVLREVVDIWIIDFKFGNDGCAEQAADVSSYVETISRHIELLKGEPHVILRHGVHPNHRECCSEPIRRYLIHRDGILYREHEIFDKQKTRK
ncbi:MAG: 4Fe-4S cluster-binding domain-containing protein [Thermoguttaceae bacterium]